MTDQPQQTNPNDHRYYPDDEIELTDYLILKTRIFKLHENRKIFYLCCMACEETMG